MTTFQILTSQTIEANTEEEAIQNVKQSNYKNLPEGTMIALTYPNARSGGNLLAPKLGNNLSGKKISVKDL